MPILNFLRASDGTPLAKTLDSEGNTTASYPLIFEFDSLEFTINTIEEFHATIEANAELSHCLLKGKLDKPLKRESRAGHTNPILETDWICLDYDGKDAYESIDAYLKDINLANIDYILQYSASAGFTETTKHKCHIFMLLEHPVEPGSIKRWVTSLNLDNSTLASRCRLDRTENSLLWALDPSTGQNDKLLYIAPPICPVSKIEKRIELCKRAKRFAPQPESFSAELLSTKKELLINQLRFQKGLPKKKKNQSAVFNGVEVLKGCPPCDITGHKIERGFHRININGGSSWGYYFPENNIEIVYNFRGEANVLLKELAPEFYKRLKTEVAKNNPVKPLAVHDAETDAYWAITHDTEFNLLSANTIASKDRIYDFLAQHGQQRPPFIPDWEIGLNPRNKNKQIDYDEKTINLFKPTKYLLANPSNACTIPPTINKAIRHICGDNETFNHFINWLAVIFQTRTRAGTAWVFQGTYGTGKGVLFHRILTPIFGPRHSTIINIANLEDQFNSFLENTIILFIDEANMSDTPGEHKVWNKLKSYITDERMPIRGMKRNMVVRENYMNVILPTNEYVPIKIEKNDRRMNVTPRQEVPLPLTMKEIEITIESELMEFCEYLAGYDADKSLAGTPLQNEARAALVDNGKNTVDLFFDAIKNMDYRYFTAFIDTSPGALSNLAYIDFTAVLSHWETATEISLSDMMRAYKYLHGAKDMTPTKFARMCKHKRCDLIQISTGEPGRKVLWK